MEQQTVSVAKAGIICTLNARTAILAAANPVNSKYDPKLSVVDNIRLPPTLLSRFDLIYLVLDKQSDAHDRRLANHIVSLYSQQQNHNFLEKDILSTENKNNPILSTELIKTGGITREFFASYISYARKNIKPKIPDYVVMDFVNEYLNMRNLGSSRKTITATPRQLESTIRLAEAVAKMRLSEVVEKRDVDEAVRLIKTAMQQSATDPVTGEIDMDLITTGVSHASTERVINIKKIIHQTLEDFKSRIQAQGLYYSNLYEYVFKKYVSQQGNKRAQVAEAQQQQYQIETEFREALRQLEDESIIQTQGHAKAPKIRLVNTD